jgi:hypothetical protein
MDKRGVVIMTGAMLQYERDTPGEEEEFNRQEAMEEKARIAYRLHKDKLDEKDS